MIAASTFIRLWALIRTTPGVDKSTCLVQSAAMVVVQHLSFDDFSDCDTGKSERPLFCFLCGPPNMIKDMARILIDLGVPKGTGPQQPPTLNQNIMTDYCKFSMS